MEGEESWDGVTDRLRHVADGIGAHGDRPTLVGVVHRHEDGCIGLFCTRCRVFEADARAALGIIFFLEHADNCDGPHDPVAVTFIDDLDNHLEHACATLDCGHVGFSY